VTSRKGHELFTLADEAGIRSHHQRGSASFNERRESDSQVSFGAGKHDMDFAPQQVSSSLCVSQVILGIGIARIDKQPKLRTRRHKLLQ